MDAKDVPSALDLTYERTQHFDSEWQHEKGVTLYVEAVRSSMTGDVFVVNGAAYLVAMVGFKPIPAWPTSPPHPVVH